MLFNPRFCSGAVNMKISSSTSMGQALQERHKQNTLMIDESEAKIQDLQQQLAASRQVTEALLQQRKQQERTVQHYKKWNDALFREAEEQGFARKGGWKLWNGEFRRLINYTRTTRPLQGGLLGKESKNGTLTRRMKQKSRQS